MVPQAVVATTISRTQQDKKNRPKFMLTAYGVTSNSTSAILRPDSYT